MAYQIHTLGKGVEITPDKTEAHWTLGSRYGGSIVNKAVKTGAIVFTDTYCKINPDKLDIIIQEVQSERVNRGLRI